jgi:hypothetical protein
MFRIRGLSLSNIIRMLGSKAGHGLNAAQHVFICVADHFEPMWANASARLQRERVKRWCDFYPKLAAEFEDSRGHGSTHSFFYPAEQYDPELVEMLAELCRAGFGEIDVQVHHENDSAQNFRDTLLTFTDVLNHRHGVLRKRDDGTIAYGFVHGNWALDNSHPRGDWCGVNNEINILHETGCYADFTLPAAPDPCQISTINSIYYAVDDPDAPKSHDTGTPATLGRIPPHDGLLMIQGPLAFDWKNKKLGLLPAIENGDLQGTRGATFERFKIWHHAGIGVVGRPDWRFVKVHTHGCDEANTEILLGETMREFYQSLQKHAEAVPEFKYYFVTAFEMAMLVHQAEDGLKAPVFPVDSFEWERRSPSSPSALQNNSTQSNGDESPC